MTYGAKLGRRFRMDKKILIIDDEREMCRILRKTLELRGKFHIITATDAKTGRELAFKENPDIILLDIVMPGMFGSQLAEELGRNPSTRSIPIIFVTALVMQSEFRKADGYMDNRMFVSKPVNIDDLLSKISILTG